MNICKYKRFLVEELRHRLEEPRRFIQVVTGPRQVGKTTAVRQICADSSIAWNYQTADIPSIRTLDWLAQQWESTRILAANSDHKTAVLVLDEIQKIPEWSGMVKKLWDEDTWNDCQVKVVLLGSAPLLMGSGLTESLAGRFEVIHLPHWTFSEMQEAFEFDLNQFLYFGGYPGAAPIISDLDRWRAYIRESLMEPSFSRDIMLLTRIEKPALMRQLFWLGCHYSSQILSYHKMLGQLHDAGNTTTLAHYLELLSKVGMMTGLQKYSGQSVRIRSSSPKLLVMNTALMSVECHKTMSQALSDTQFKGRLVESAVGAHLANAAAKEAGIRLFYWRENNHEVDFVVETHSTLTAIEVKSGQSRRSGSGMHMFSKKFAPTRMLLVGEGGIPIGDFLSKDAEHWVM